MKRPKKGEFAPFHETYLKLLPPRGTAQSLLKKTFREARQLLLGLQEEQGNYTYEPGKWTIKQMLMHLIDSERVFSYRILSFIRGDRIALPGFNQDIWMEEVNVSERTIKDMLLEWKVVRDNTLFLLSQCTEEQSKFIGTASGWKVTPRALFYVIIGHQIHHMNILREKYLYISWKPSAVPQEFSGGF
ncbi:MAG: DinB family protein [Lewinellaceae bacterium]|nr:DinB family protein [Lewinellaceae bacterium]